MGRSPEVQVKALKNTHALIYLNVSFFVCV